MGQYDDIFNEKNKVSINHEGEIFKFNDWTVGCMFAGVYIGNHTWQGDDGMVVAHDFARCEINGKEMDKNQVYTINEFAQLRKLLENVTPGQIICMRYNGRSKDVKGQPHNVTAYIEANRRDENWRSYAGASIDSVLGVSQSGPELSPPLESSEPEVATAEAFDSKVEVPFKTAVEIKKEITDIVKKKYPELKSEAEIKVKVIQDAELPYNDELSNLEAILVKLTEVYSA